MFTLKSSRKYTHTVGDSKVYFRFLNLEEFKQTANKELLYLEYLRKSISDVEGFKFVDDETGKEVEFKDASGKINEDLQLSVFEFIVQDDPDLLGTLIEASKVLSSKNLEAGQELLQGSDGVPANVNPVV